MSIGNVPGQQNWPVQNAQRVDPRIANNPSLSDSMDTLNEQKAMAEAQIREQARMVVDTLIESKMDEEINHIIELVTEKWGNWLEGHFEGDVHTWVQFDVKGFWKLDIDTKHFGMDFVRSVRDADFLEFNPNLSGSSERVASNYVSQKLNARMTEKRGEYIKAKEIAMNWIITEVIANWDTYSPHIKFPRQGQGNNRGDIRDAGLSSRLEAAGISEREFLIALKERKDSWTVENNQPQPEPADENLVASNDQAEAMRIAFLAPLASIDFSKYDTLTAALQAPENEAARKVIQKIVGTTEDGIYGAGTANAVKVWQEDNGLADDGIFGPDSTTFALENVTLSSSNITNV